jgi:hypothetical protein
VVDEQPGETALRLLSERLDASHARTLDGLTLEELVDEVARLKPKDEMYYI